MAGDGKEVTAGLSLVCVIRAASRRSGVRAEACGIGRDHAGPFQVQGIARAKALRLESSSGCFKAMARRP